MGGELDNEFDNACKKIGHLMSAKKSNISYSLVINTHRGYEALHLGEGERKEAREVRLYATCARQKVEIAFGDSVGKDETFMAKVRRWRAKGELHST